MARKTIGNLLINVLLDATAFEASLSKMERSLDRSGKRLRDLGERLTYGVTVPMVAAGAAAVKMGADFDQTMTRIEGLVGASQADLERYRAAILALGPAVGKGPKELANALYFVTSAGFAGKEALDIVTMSSKAASAGLGSTAVVADALTSALNAYRSKGLDAATATGVLVAAVREGKAEADRIAPALGKVIPVAEALGVSFNDVGAAVAAMTRTGLDADEATTALRGALMSILSPSEQAKTALFNVGLSLSDVQGMLRERGLLSTLERLKVALGGNSQALSKFFEENRALVGVLSLVGGNAEEVRGVFERMATSGPADIEKAFGAAARSPAFKFASAMAAIEVATTRVGLTIIPMVVPAVEALTGAVVTAAEKFAALPDSTKRASLGIAALVAAVGPALIGLGLVASAISALLSPVVVSVTLLATAGYLMIKNWTEVAEGIGTISDFIVEKFDVMRAAVEIVLQPFVALMAAIRLTAGAFNSNLKPASEDAMASLKALGASIKLSMNGGLEEMRTRIDEVISKLSAMRASGTVDLKGLEDALSRVKTGALEMGEGFKGAAKEVDTFWSPTAKEMQSHLRSLMTTSASTMGSLTADLVKGRIGFQEFARSVIQDITRVMIQMAAMKAFGPVGSSFAGGFFSGFGGFFAAGGEPPTNRPSIVGERGPEWFIPKTAGTIVPMGEMMAAGAGGGGISISIAAAPVDISDRATVRRFMRGLGDEVKRQTAAAIELSRRLGDANGRNSRRAV